MKNHTKAEGANPSKIKLGQERISSPTQHKRNKITIILLKYLFRDFLRSLKPSLTCIELPKDKSYFLLVDFKYYSKKKKIDFK